MIRIKFYLRTIAVLFIVFLLMLPAQASNPSYSDKEIDKRIVEYTEASSDLLKKGEEYLKKGSLNQALTFFWQAHEIAPFNPEPFVFLINVYLKLNQKDTVLKLLEKATSINTNEDYILKKFLSGNQINFNDQNADEKIYIAAFKGNRKAAFSFCFDDGAQSVYDLALPIFDEFDFKATIPINPGVTTESITNPWWGSWEQWRDASKKGHEIANHSMSHGILLGTSDDKLEQEVNKSYELIKEKVGKAPSTFVFPGDEADNKSIKKAKEKHLILRKHDFLSKVYDNIFIPVYGGSKFYLSTANTIVDFAIRQHLWVIAECHAVKTENVKKTFKPLPEDLLRSHLEYIKNKEKEIWVDTLKNIYFYLYVKSNAKLVIESEGETYIDFRIRKLDKNDMPLFPLTVVIDLSKEKIYNIKISLKDLKMPLTYTYKDDKVLLDITPGMPTAHVTWDNK